MKADRSVVVDVSAADVGYFSTKLSLGRKLANESGKIATALFPSLAPRLPSGMKPHMVLANKTDGTVITMANDSYFVGRDAVMFSSGREPREVLNNYSRTPKYAALLKGALNYMAVDKGSPTELVIRHLVLGLPLNTFGEHKDALVAIAQGEHLFFDGSNEQSHRRVTVERASVIVQPQGALVNYGVEHSLIFDNKWVLVIDTGGGTLDWYLARGRTPNWTRSGAHPKGMLACAYAVADGINPVWRDNFEIIERIDSAIRKGAPSFTTAGVEYDLKNHAGAIDAVLRESTDKMLSKLGSLDNLDLILFSGGGAAVYQEFFLRNFPNSRAIAQIDDDPVFANVKGFHLAGEIMSKPVGR